jgi:hypothetical protein
MADLHDNNVWYAINEDECTNSLLILYVGLKFNRGAGLKRARAFIICCCGTTYYKGPYYNEEFPVF